MTRHDAPVARLREIARWWPLILIPVLIAVAAATVSVIQQRPTYTATARFVVVPLVQWDETFLGTSLVRDAGDTKRTATTMAEVLNSRRAATTTAEHLGSGWTPEAVDDMVNVAVVKDTNVIEVVANTADPDHAVRVAEGFARATLDDRWRTIAGELDARIATVAAAAAGPAPGEAATRLQTLTAVRDAGTDPTLRMDSTTPAVEDARPGIPVIIGLAAAGGLFIGVLAAVGMARLRRRPPTVNDAVGSSIPVKSPVSSPNGGR
jgi:capsular polysaccharide biosynthesis protein